jgi:hypothetical protein
MNNLKITKDNSGTPTWGIDFAETGSIINLAAAGSATLTVPNTANVALIQVQPGATVLISNSAAPTAPTGSFTATTAQINPGLRPVREGSTLYFYAVDAAIIVVSFYSEP